MTPRIRRFFNSYFIKLTGTEDLQNQIINGELELRLLNHGKTN